jgi:predicted DNA-binding protein (MmcQ/YjbR family)
MNLTKAKAYCRKLPGATEDIKWETNLVFSIGGKMFAVSGADGSERGISFKVDDDRFLELTDRPGIIPAPYLARAKWVYIEDPKAISDAELAELLQRSYELVFAKLTKKLQREIQGL